MAAAFGVLAVDLTARFTLQMATPITLRPNKQGTFLGRHPWVLAKSLCALDSPPADGAEVDLMLPNGRWLARGLYNSRSYIRARLYSWTRGETLDSAFWRSRLQAAFQLRRDLGYDDPLAACRLVFSEADGLSGLIIDRYGSHLVVQVTARVMAERRQDWLEPVLELAQPQGVLLRTDAKIAQAEGMEVQEGLIWGSMPAESLWITEHGNQFRVDLTGGQKTGGYLDQRENHRAAASYARGRRVLDVCCYVGGFSLCAARHGPALHVLGIDGSQRAVEEAQANAQANRISNVTFETGDCFERLDALRTAGERFGMVILDPPRFAGSKHGVDQALRAYHRLNRLGVELLEPEGILVTCSCSGRVTRDDFLRMLGGVAQKSGRDIQILEQRGAAPDHPVRISCPETDYLKCFICRVTAGSPSA